MNSLNDLTNQYPVTKTVCFGLEPQGKTLEQIQAKGIIERDAQRAEDYKQVKLFLDQYHITFIEDCLNNFKLKLESDGHHDSLTDYIEFRYNSDKSSELCITKDNLRKQIAAAFKNGKSYSYLFKKDLIQSILPEFLTEDKDRNLVYSFNRFTTYFSGYNENRKNMYTDEAKSTSIAYRIIEENLPIFTDNIKSFKTIESHLDNDKIQNVYDSFKEYLNVEYISNIFQLDYFSDTLTQKQIEVYNSIIGGRTNESGEKIQGLNEYVNLYNQQQKEKSSRLPLLKPLYKMILADRDPISWLTNGFESDEEMLEAIKCFHNGVHDTIFGSGNITDDNSLISLLGNIREYDPDGIYISNGEAINQISQQLFGKYDMYSNAIKEHIKSEIKPTKKDLNDPELRQDRINKIYKSLKSFSISFLNSVVKQNNSSNDIEDYFQCAGAFDRGGNQTINLFSRIEIAYNEALSLFSQTCNGINQSAHKIEQIKTLLDAYKELQHFIKPLLGSGEEPDKDNTFYAKLKAIWDSLDSLNPLYNNVRDWLTRKPYSDEKIKLNFENKGDLLGGWVDSKTENSDNGTQYGGYLFRKINQIGEYDYYLGISADTKLFRRCSGLKYEPGMFERLDYYQLKSQTIYGSSYAGDYGKDARQLLDAFRYAIYKKDIDISFAPENDEKVPSYLKRLKRDKAVYDVLMEDINVSREYEAMKSHFLQTLGSLSRVESALKLASRSDLDIDQLFQMIEDMPSKSFGFFPVSNEEIKMANERDNKPLFLFKITNKDLSYAATYSTGVRKSRGTESLNTMYFKALFEEGQGTYDIGTGEVFYRKQTLGLAESTAIHKAYCPIENKNTLNTKRSSSFKYDIVKNKRYTCDKFQLHLSLTANYDAKSRCDINESVKEIIRKDGIQHIIGIDRGERNLLYLSLIDLSGQIIKQMSLNEIVNEFKGNLYKTDYKNLLESKEGDRGESRKNWKTIENIKDIKEGYLSQVIHLISEMITKYNAIVVLEDLNHGFMRGRQKIERQVYERFEKMLIDKLNYYVNKKIDVNSVGGLYNALQLTSKFESFKKLGKQSGCLFYIPAWNTSKIDPVTGFVNLLDARYENVEKARVFFSKFDSIRYNKGKDFFEFALDYNNFTDRAFGTKTKWTICSYGTRVRTFRDSSKNNLWQNETVELTDEFKSIFKNAGIDISGNLKEAICKLDKKDHLEPLMKLTSLMVQMRNSITGSQEDYILSPVADETGIFYDSRICDDGLPKDADANGAFNIARKGLWLLNQIKNSTPGDKINLAISNKEWLKYAQEKPYKAK